MATNRCAQFPTACAKGWIHSGRDQFRDFIWGINLSTMGGFFHGLLDISSISPILNAEAANSILDEIILQ